ncbi:phosphotransferase [Aurantibacter crassamenti]|uniref:phosphotransferase n=1 Tax=Aurantibacter crassamenti TaxID=1837375 RepID=UPI00193A863C|nr:phosphotransferase [Aurantibacter crassamenti]MBM1104702.1 phosphotransferase [Aurantibacter crassamenti]
MNTFDQNTLISALQEYLHVNNWLLSKNEAILAIEKPGEGNMNVVLRIKTNQRSFILKQSRPFVQKYQQIAAPLERLYVEYQFYKTLKQSALSAHMPKILGFDIQDYLMLLEDLGDCEDMVTIYNKKEVDKKVFQKLIFIIGLIHRTKVTDDFPENKEMRQLNHQHIFVLPFLENNGFSLDEVQMGLQELSLPYKQDKALKKVIKKVGKKYLSKGNTLLHGDYYPGSWMTEKNNLYVIDPEFSFKGFAEFDLGVMAAHLIMATGKKKYLNRIYQNYDGEVDFKLLSRVAGIEIMRRIIGLAQLPLDRTIEEKKALLKKARKMILA